MNQKGFANIILIIVIIVLVGVAQFFIFNLTLAAVGPTGTYSDWYFPGTVAITDYKNFSWDITVNTDPSPQSYFYSTQFWFIKDDKSIDLNGGYFGIQTQGYPAPTGKIAILSIWGAIDASGPEYSEPFAAEGTGYSVRISYPWIKGRTYHLRIGPIAADAIPNGQYGQWWGAWIKDTVTGVEKFVGEIKLPETRLLLYNPPLSWTEYYGPPFSTCNEYGFSDVSFTNMAANDGAIKSNRYNNHLANPISCPGSNIINITDGTRQQMGYNPTTPTPTPVITPTPTPILTPTPTPSVIPTPTPSATPTPTPTKTPTPTPTPNLTPTLTPSVTPTPTPSKTPTSVPTVKLIRFSNDPKVYEVTEDNKIKWVPSITVFNQLGLNWKNVTVEPPNNAPQYQRVKLMRAEGDAKVYYITEGGLKRHISNAETFISYGNKWSDVATVKSFELPDIPDNILIKEEGKPEVYKLENGTKRWIKTAETFTRLGFKWNEIAPVNNTELNSYSLGAPIE